MKKLFLFASAVALLASCSKELAEVVAVDPVINGSNKIVASYESDTETRSYFDGERMAWNRGDALGVISQQDGSGNAYFGYDGTAFYGDLMSVKGEAFYIYYPWKEDKATKGNLNAVEFTIPAVQKYNYLNSSKYGSFASGVVPAVAEAELESEKTVDSELKATMLPIASFIAFPIKGSGYANEVTLEIKNGEKSIALASSINVDFTKAGVDKKNDLPLFYTHSIQDGGATVITLDCASDIHITDNPTWFLFVVNPELELKGNLEIIVTVNGEKLTPYTVTNANVLIGRNQLLPINDQAGFEWIQGTTGSYVIKTAEQFVEYAYAATNGYLEGAPEAMFTDEDHSALKSAMIVEPLGMSSINVEDRLPDYEDENGEWDAYKKAVFYDWYYKNGNAIETIGGKLRYSIVGNVAGEAAVIEGLNVIGNGVFSTNHDSVKDIVLKEATVTTDATDAVFITGSTWYFEALDVTVDGGELVAEKAETKSMVKYILTTDLVNKKYNIAGTPGNVDYLAECLLVAGNEKSIDLGVEYFEPNFAFNRVVAHKGTTYNQGTIINLPTEANAISFIDAIDTEDSYAGGWFSVIAPNAKNETASYWTGFDLNKLTSDSKLSAKQQLDATEVVTAEALTAAAQNGTRGIANPLVLTNHIVLSHSIKWEAKYHASVFSLDGNGKTISSFNVGENGLFGGNYNDGVTVKKLNLTNGFVNVQDVQGATPYLLSKTGTATDVTVTNVTYRIPATASVKDDVIGGLFYEANIDVAGQTKGTVKPSDPKYGDNAQLDINGGEIKFAQLYAKVNVDLSKAVYNVNAEVANAFGLYSFYGGKEGKNHSTTIYFAKNRPDKENVNYVWDTATEGDNGKGIGDGHTIFFENKGEAKLNNIIQYDGSLSDVDGVNAALNQGMDVTLADDITVDKVFESGTGYKGGIYQNGGTLNGDGHTLYVTESIPGIYSQGGTIENLTIEGGSSAILTAYPNESLTIKNCVLKANKYSIFCQDRDDYSKTLTLTIDQTIIHGWTSLSTYDAILLTEVEFIKGTTYTAENDPFKNYSCRMYKPTIFTGCTFPEGWQVIRNTGDITFVNCTVGGVPVTAENINTLVVNEFEEDKGKLKDGQFITMGSVTVGDEEVSAKETAKDSQFK